jgi:hypothetical protein
MDCEGNLLKHVEIAATDYADKLSLRRAIEAFGEAQGHDFEIAHELGVLKERHSRAMVGRCKNCHQIAVARINPWPKPLLFGRRSWKAVELVTGAHCCSYMQRQNWGIDHKDD